MRDATQDIITSLKVLLGELYSSGTKFSPVEVLPEALAYNHIWIREISATQENTKDSNVQRVILNLEIIAGGAAQKGSLTAVNDISDKMLQIVPSLTLSNFDVVMSPLMTSYRFVEERTQHENQTIIIERKQLNFEMLIQERWK